MSAPFSATTNHRVAPSRSQQAFAAVLVSLYAGLLLLPLLAPFWHASASRIAWLLDLATHWQLALAGLWPLFLLCIARTTKQRRYLALLPLLAMPWLTASPVLSPAPDSTSPNGSREPRLTVAVANMRLDNTDPTRLQQWLKERQPDVFVLLELTPSLAASLDLTSHPYRYLRPDNSPFGLGIYSAHPLRERVTHSSASGVPQLHAVVDWQGHAIRVVAHHPMPPLSAAFRAELDVGMRALVQQARSPLLVLGDFNATPWSAAFSGLCPSAERCLRRATGLRPSWPTASAGWFGIPIDHVLASAHFRSQHSGLGPDLGSDHLPVWAELVVR